ADGRASPAWCANATSSAMGALAVLYTARTTYLLTSARWRGGDGRGTDGCEQRRRRHEPPQRRAFGKHTPESPKATYGSNDLSQRCRWWNGGDAGTILLLRGLASGCAALLMAFSPLTWQYSVTAEVFALNNFLLSLLCSLAVRFSFRRDLTTATGGAFVSGLALSNQHTSVLYVIPLAAWVLYQFVTSRCRHFCKTQLEREQHQQHPLRRISSEALVLSFGLLLGLMPYAFLPLAAKYAPKPGSWGNVATWSGLLHHVRRGDYGSFRLYSGKVGGGGGDDRTRKFLQRLGSWLSDLSSVQGLGGVVPAFAMVGALSLLVFTPSREGGQGERGNKESTLACVASGSTSSSGSARNSHANESSSGIVFAPSSGSRKIGSEPPPSSKKNGGRRRSQPSQSVGKTTKDNEKRRGLAGGGDCDDTEHMKGEDGQDLRMTRKTSTMVKILASWDDAGYSAPTALFAALSVYLVVFHWLSNMPLDDPLLFGVHARFWMQPNMVVFVFFLFGMYRTFDLIRSV
ncbi:unnamed protein product, partial [Hapterophycus canaliculatus]